MSATTAPANGVTSGTTVSDQPYEVSQEEVDAMFAAAAAGDLLTVVKLLAKFGLGWYSYDIQRLTELSKKYGPLETHGDALISLLQTHDEGAVSVNKEMIAYLDEALLRAKEEGKEASGEIKGIINKVKNNQKISEEEAKKLYSWALEMKEIVIPAEYRIEKISNELNTLQDGYEEQLRKAGRLADVV